MGFWFGLVFMNGTVKDFEIDDVLVAEAREMAKELVG
jgi:hypothetical protein